jgi:hypothetical protein
MATTHTSTTSSTIYYQLPKMNPKNILNLVPLYYSSNITTHLNSFGGAAGGINNNSVQFFLKDFQDGLINSPSFYSNKKYSAIKKKPQDIDKEWSKLNPLLIQLHLFHNPLNFLSNLNLNDSSWNFIHYFPLTFINNVIPNHKFSPSLGLFLLPHSFYLSNLQSVDLILSLYDISEEQIIYLSLFALLVQNHKGSFILKINYFYTTLIMDILHLLSCVYNKVILLPIDYVHFYVVCKGFQSDILKPHYEKIKTILQIMRPNSLQRIVSSIPSSSSSHSEISLRLFSKPLPSLFTSKIEEINVLIHHKQLIAVND